MSVVRDKDGGERAAAEYLQILLDLVALAVGSRRRCVCAERSTRRSSRPIPTTCARLTPNSLQPETKATRAWPPFPQQRPEALGPPRPRRNGHLRGRHRSRARGTCATRSPSPGGPSARARAGCRGNRECGRPAVLSDIYRARAPEPLAKQDNLLSVGCDRPAVNTCTTKPAVRPWQSRACRHGWSASWQSRTGVRAISHSRSTLMPGSARAPAGSRFRAESGPCGRS
jgi:hypothetical protein